MKEDTLYLIHISECIQKIEEYTAEGRQRFMATPMAQDAVIRNFEIIGEAVKNLSDDFKQRNPEIPWRRVAGFRDVLIHDYMGVSLDEVWNIVQTGLAELKRVVRENLEGVYRMKMNSNLSP